MLNSTQLEEKDILYILTECTYIVQPQLIAGKAKSYINMQQEKEYKAHLNSLQPCEEQPGQQQRPLAKWSSIINK